MAVMMVAVCFTMRKCNDKKKTPSGIFPAPCWVYDMTN